MFRREVYQKYEWELVMRDNEIKSENVIETCREFCQALTHDEVETFLRFTKTRDIEAWEVIADMGEVGDEFFLVTNGEVRLFQEESSTEIEVGRIKPGGLVGEMSFFDKLPRTVRLKAGKQGASLVVVTRPMYKRLTIEHSFIAVNLLEFIILSLDKLVRNTSKNISSLHKSMTDTGDR